MPRDARARCWAFRMMVLKRFFHVGRDVLGMVDVATIASSILIHWCLAWDSQLDAGLDRRFEDVQASVMHSILDGLLEVLEALPRFQGRCLECHVTGPHVALWLSDVVIDFRDASNQLEDTSRWLLLIIQIVVALQDLKGVASVVAAPALHLATHDVGMKAPEWWLVADEVWCARMSSGHPLLTHQPWCVKHCMCMMLKHSATLDGIFTPKLCSRLSGW